MRRRRAGGAAGVACMALCAVLPLLAGCGDSTAAADVVSQGDPAQILAASRAALGHVHTLRTHGSFQQAGGQVVVDVAVVVPGTVDFAFSQGTLRGEVIAVGGRLYVKAPQAFWAASNAAQARRYADRWVRLPATASQLDAILDVSDPGKLADCLIGEVGGPLSRQGTASVDGRRAVVLLAKGGVPGSAPTRLYVAADGPPLPLRLEQTGPGLPGGTHTCRGGGLTTNTADTQRGTVDFSGYDGGVNVAAPKDAVDAG